MIAYNYFISHRKKKEKHMEEAKIAWNEKVATKIIKNLEKRRMEGSYAPTGAQAKEEVLAMIPRGAMTAGHPLHQSWVLSLLPA